VNGEVDERRARLEFERKVSKAAPRFELKPLLDLLHSKGYGRGDILFEGSYEGSTSSLVQSVRFRSRSSHKVVITLSLGLLGDNSLLPSYFLQVAEMSREPEKFYDFIRFFDHWLIQNFVRAMCPEDDPAIYGDYHRVQTAFFKMLGVGSVSTLKWLMQLCFPDLCVRVTRRPFTEATSSHAFRTGESRLDGSGIIGRVYESDSSGFVVDLIAEEEQDAHGRNWPSVIRPRLEQTVLPLLESLRIPLLVRLRILHHASWSRVDFPFADEHGYLGYERIRDDEDSRHTVVMYRGIVGEARLGGD